MGAKLQYFFDLSALIPIKKIKHSLKYATNHSKWRIMERFFTKCNTFFTECNGVNG